MSELNEDFLLDGDTDLADLAGADEEALLQDDDDNDVLDIPVVELEPSDGDLDRSQETDDEKSKRQDKFKTERTRIKAPSPSFNESNYKNKPHRGGVGGNRGQRSRGNGRYQNKNGNEHQMRNKKVFINPTFKGVVPVYNDARLAWDNSQHPPVWSHQNPPMQQMIPMQPSTIPIQPYQNMQPVHIPMQQPPVQNIQMPAPMQFIPQQQNYMPQPLPPGVQPQIQAPPQMSYWNGQNPTPIPQGPMQQSQEHFMNYQQQNYQQTPVIINTAHPPPNMQAQNYPSYNDQVQYQNLPQQPQRQVFSHNQGDHFGPRPRMMRNNRGGANAMGGATRQVMGGNTQQNWSNQKRKNQGDFGQNKKRQIHERLGSTVHKNVTKIRTMQGEVREPVVREVTFTNVTTVHLEDDEETRDLRQKIEDQKRKREALLAWKEKRRLEMLKESSQNTNLSIPENIPQNAQGKKKYFTSTRNPNVTVLTQNDEQSSFKFKKQTNNIVVTNGWSRRSTKYQKNSKNVINCVMVEPQPVQIKQEPVQIKKEVDADLQLDKEHLSSFLSERKILVKDESLMNTRKVVIKNIATSTGDKKIIQICKSIGDVQKLHREKKNSQATIFFKSVASAHAFFKKYQRHMLDLSMIEVSLCPESE